MHNVEEYLADSTKIDSCNIPWLERDLTKESYNSGQFRLMESPLFFLVSNECLLDPSGNPFRYEMFYGCEDPRPATGKPWEGLRKGFPLLWEIMPFEESYLRPSPRSPYLNTKEGRVENTLDKKRLRRILASQLGNDAYPTTLSRYEEEPENFWRLMLFSAFLLLGWERVSCYPSIACLPGITIDNPVRRGWAILDIMNRAMGGSGAFDPLKIHEACKSVDKGFFLTLYAKYCDCRITRGPDGKDVVLGASIFDGYSNFENVALSRLLARARRNGVVSTASFGWVKGLDRTLWYALSQEGRASACAEAIGVKAHMLVEDVMEKHYDVPIVEPAIETIEKRLIASGWLPPEKEEK